MNINIDSAICVGFLVINLAVGLFFSGGVKNIKDYAIGDRKFSTASLTATIIATFIGGGSFSMWTSGVYTEGLYFIVLGIFDALRFFIICYIIAPRCGEFLGNLSIASAIGNIYGPITRYITAFVGLFGVTGNIAMQFKVGAIVLSYAFGDLGNDLMILAAIVLITYSAFGGVKAVVMTDVVQLLTFAVFIPVLAFIMWNNLDNPLDVIDTISLNPIFDYNNLFNFSNYQEILGFVLVVMVFACPDLNPAIFQRLAIATNVKQVRSSFFWAGFCIILITLLTYWIAILLLTKTPTLEYDEIIPYLLDNYSYVGLRGLILAGILAILISTADSYVNAAAILFAHDLARPIGFVQSGKAELFISRIASVMVGILAIVLAMSFRTMLELILFVNSFYMPIVTVPLLLAILGFRSSTRATLIGMIAGASTTIFFYVYKVKLDPIIPAMLTNASVVFITHYMLGEPRGWVGIKDQVSLEEIRQERRKRVGKLVSSIKGFNLMTFFKNNTPKHEYIYFSFGLFSMVSMFCVMHAMPKDIHAQYSWMSSLIFNSVLFLSSVFLSYPAWPEKFKSENLIAIVWNIGVPYVMVFSISLLVIMSGFGQLPLMIFMVNLIVISALMRWQTALFMLVVGIYGAIAFFKWHEGISTLQSGNIELQFKFIYAVLLITSSLVMFLKPKQEYLEATEVKVGTLETEVTHLGHEVIGLSGQVTGLSSKVIDLNEQVTHYSQRTVDQEKEIERLGATAQKILNNVNHELRLPIGNVVNFSEMLSETLGKSDNKLVKELSKEVYDNSNRASTMILNMLDLATLDVKKVDLQKTMINFSELVTDRVKTCRKIYLRDKKIDFELTIEPEVMIAVDPNYIRQTVDNLVINAINFSREGLIKVAVSKQPGQVMFTIIDQGKGIPTEELSDIFTPFKMGSNSESKAQGRGVGLALCKSAVEAHGGSITANSNGKIGATFRFILPI